MKHRNERTLSIGGVGFDVEVTLVPDGGLEDTNKLREALALVDRYKKAAMKVFSLREKDADYTDVQFNVKNDCVIVTITQGSGG